MDFKKYLIVLVFLVAGIFIGRMLPTNTAVDNTAATSRTQPSTAKPTTNMTSGGAVTVPSNTSTDLRGGGAGVVAPTNPDLKVQNTPAVSPYAGISVLSKNSYRGNIFNDTEEVKNLQKFLVASGFLVGNADGKFGPMTQLAVMKFQKANLISPIAGYVGSTTRAYINQVISDPYNANRANTAECPCSKAGYPGRWATAEDGDGDGEPACQVTSHCEMYGW